MNKLLFTFLFLALTFYCLGAGLMEHFALFYGWTLAGETNFTYLHHQSGLRSLYVYVLPLVLLMAMNVGMLRFGLPALSRRWLWAGLGCHLITWVSSVLIQIPLQLQLDQAMNSHLLQQLITTDWIRLSALLLLILFTVLSVWPLRTQLNQFAVIKGT